MAILTVGPLLGSFITEPAAMTICALLLARQFYDLGPSPRLKYATLGLLFVNVSIGGTLTHFAAPPVLMVARLWNWDTPFMLTHFGGRAVTAILVATSVYFLAFRRELLALATTTPAPDIEEPDEDIPAGAPALLPVPGWVTSTHVAFLAWTVVNAHYPALFIGGFLFFLGFVRATAAYQSQVSLRAPLLVGFFLGALVIHGGLQGLVDRADAGEPLQGSAVLRCHAPDGRERQRAHHLPRDARARLHRPTQARRCPGRCHRWGADGDCERAQPGRPGAARTIFWRRHLSDRSSRRGARAHDHRDAGIPVALTAPPVTPSIRPLRYARNGPMKSLGPGGGEVRLPRALLRVTLLIAACASGPSALAQTPGLPAGTTAPAQAAPPAAPAVEVDAPPPVYVDTTPRGALFRFLDEARRNDYTTAATHLDLSAIPGQQRAEQGPRLARQLKVVFDRNRWFDVEKVSDQPAGDRDDGLPANTEKIGTIRSSDGDVDIILRRIREPDGSAVWMFSAALVERIPSLYDEFGYGWLGDRVPESLRRMRAWNLEGWQAIGLLVLTALAWVVSWGGSLVLARFATPLVRHTETEVDDRLLETMRRPIRWIIAVVFFSATIGSLHISAAASVWVNRGLGAFAFVTAIMLVTAILEGFAQAARARMESQGERSGAAIVTFVNRMLKALLASIATIGILQALGFNVTGLLAGLGIGGIAVALAAQKTLDNLFGGLTMMVDKPVKIGEFCRFGTQTGFVEEFGFRSTRVRTLERSVISIPNGVFANIEIENLSERDRMRFLTTLQLRYETTVDQMRAVLDGVRALLVHHPRVAHDAMRVRFTGLGDSALTAEIQCYVLTTDVDEFFAVREELLLRIMEVVSGSGTGFAFPSHTVYVAQDAGVRPLTMRAPASPV